MLENAVYSVLSQEGFASILWKDAKRSKEACEVMKMTAEELYAGGLCDQVIPEAEGGIQEDFSGGCSQLRKALRTSLPALMKTNAEILLENRYQKYRHIEGEYHAIRKKA